MKTIGLGIALLLALLSLGSARAQESLCPDPHHANTIPQKPLECVVQDGELVVTNVTTAGKYTLGEILFLGPNGAYASYRLGQLQELCPEGNTLFPGQTLRIPIPDLDCLASAILLFDGFPEPTNLALSVDLVR